MQSISKFERGFGVYVHIPYCVHKCSYCDFYSFTDFKTQDFESILKAYKIEIETGARWIFENLGEPPRLDSIFFGGGTPSLLPGRHIRQILQWIEKKFRVDENTEITLEANPETVSAEFCKELLLTKVNRVSLGAQSFKKENLTALERLGKRESIHDAVRLLWESGYRNLSLDLIFGIPGQTPRLFEEDLVEAASLPINHLSAYQLTLKPPHVLYRDLPKDEASLEFYAVVETKTAALGFQQYEISNYSKPGWECRHNLLYWNGGDYLGVGPSASSRFFSDGSFLHRKQLADVKRYLANPEFPFIPLEKSNASQTVLEASFLELRKNIGVELEGFKARYSYDLRNGKKYGLFKREGLIIEKEGDLLLTQNGRLLADSITSQLID